MTDALRFNKENYTIETCSYKGTEIVYRYYKDLCYVEKPVDVTYQTINIKEPISIDGKTVDCSKAPMIFALGCAGFLSSIASREGMFAPPEGGMMPPGGPGGMPPIPGGMGKAASEITDSGEWEAIAGGMGHAGMGITGIPLLGSMPMKMPGIPGAGEMMEPPGGDRYKMLAQGYVLVEVGCRGRENQWPNGTFYGKAPAAQVDIKAAIRYVRHNRDVIPGDTEKIITTGGSGGGWQSTLTAASGNCKWFEPYLKELGAAEERDDIFASYSTSPIIDHENADGAIEWQGGSLITDSKDKENSDALVREFDRYLKTSGFEGRNEYGTLTVDNLGQYIAKEYLIPDCNRTLSKMNEDERSEYLSTRPWIKWNGKTSDFTFKDFGQYAPRNAMVPSFDDLPLSQPGPNLYGTENQAAQNFTDFSLRLATGDSDARVDQNLMDTVHSQNPTWHILQKHSDVAPHWWIRHGACDSCLAVAPAVLLTTALENTGKDVNCRLVWDGGHCEDDDQEDFMRWLAEITGYHCGA